MLSSIQILENDLICSSYLYLINGLHLQSLLIVYGNLAEANPDRPLKMLLWAQKWLNEVAAYPCINDLAKATFEGGAPILLHEEVAEIFKSHPSDEIDEFFRGNQSR